MNLLIIIIILYNVSECNWILDSGTAVCIAQTLIIFFYISIYKVIFLRIYYYYCKQHRATVTL